MPVEGRCSVYHGFAALAQLREQQSLYGSQTSEKNINIYIALVIAYMYTVEICQTFKSKPKVWTARKILQGRGHETYGTGGHVRHRAHTLFSAGKEGDKSSAAGCIP